MNLKISFLVVFVLISMVAGLDLRGNLHEKRQDPSPTATQTGESTTTATGESTTTATVITTYTPIPECKRYCTGDLVRNFEIFEPRWDQTYETIPQQFSVVYKVVNPENFATNGLTNLNITLICPTLNVCAPVCQNCPTSVVGKNEGDFTVYQRYTSSLVSVPDTSDCFVQFAMNDTHVPKRGFCFRIPVEFDEPDFP